jgi:2,5-diketo-D-gluconate reductase A
VIPKSGNPIHIKENIELFDFTIDEEDMSAMKSLDKNLHLCWNPETIA